MSLLIKNFKESLSEKEMKDIKGGGLYIGLPRGDNGRCLCVAWCSADSKVGDGQAQGLAVVVGFDVPTGPL